VSALREASVYCPYCGERIDVLVDPSVPQQDYIEDCRVCCRPILFDVSVDEDDGIVVQARNENE